MSPNTCWLCKTFRAEENGITSKVFLEEMLQWSQSFENLVTSKYGPIICKIYLKTEHSDENMEFWLACEACKKVKGFPWPGSYIQSQAPSEININNPARKATTRNIQEPTRSWFDETQRIIHRHMERDSYPRFLESQFYQKLKQSLQTNGNSSMGN
ncbi:RGS13 protein, partial [Prunella himalayana]|nr:RGS13 protein [Prunella himalayana]